MWGLRTVMLLALVAWIGGIIFFAFVMAPTLFIVLPTPRLAADVVGPALSELHWLGMISGAAFLAASVFYNWRRYLRPRLFTAAHFLLLLMLALTAFSQFSITPRMRELRAQEPTQAAAGEFNRLHEWSTRSEGAVLLVGLAVVALTARRFGESGS